MGRKRGHKPVRTCVGCGAKVTKDRLTRLVLGRSGLIEVDPFHRSPGRGGYVCPDLSCRSGLATNRRLGRTLKLDGPVRFAPSFQNELARLVPEPSASLGPDQSSVRLLRRKDTF